MGRQYDRIHIEYCKLLTALEFDKAFFGRPCYRLRPPISEADWNQFEIYAGGGVIFADLKNAASDLVTARKALDHSFRKICIQVELTHELEHAEPCAGIVFADELELTSNQRRQHAEHFYACRFRQDPLISTEVASQLYTAWIANSLNGSKRIAHIGNNFCSFEDKGGIRRIDLLSVIDKRRGYATQLLKAIVHDAILRSLKGVVVSTEIENEPAIRAYQAAGFAMSSFITVFHFIN